MPEHDKKLIIKGKRLENIEDLGNRITRPWTEQVRSMQDTSSCVVEPRYTIDEMLAIMGEMLHLQHQKEESNGAVFVRLI